MIDHTLLKPDATRAEIETLCREAAEYRFASVCVNPTWVAHVRPAAARARGVEVCSVVGFPLGATTRRRRSTTRRGARSSTAPREIDMVINVGALKSGDLRLVERDIEAVTGAVPRGRRAQQGHHRGGAPDRRREGRPRARWRRRPRADFVKTSTGFGPGGATAADVALMRRVVGDDMGVKAAGGVRTSKG